MCFECAVNEGDRRAARNGGTFFDYLIAIFKEHPGWNTPVGQPSCKVAEKERGAIVRRALGVKTNEEALEIIDKAINQAEEKPRSPEGK
jgi:hypothetical protein